MAININAPLKVNAMDDNGNYLPKAEITYGPYTSKSAAVESLASLYRGASNVPLGVSFGVVSNGNLIEYQYKTGVFNATNCIEAGAVSRDNGESFESAFTRIEGELSTLDEKAVDVDEQEHTMTYKGMTYLLIGIDDSSTPSSMVAIMGEAIMGTSTTMGAK